MAIRGVVTYCPPSRTNTRREFVLAGGRKLALQRLFAVYRPLHHDGNAPSGRIDVIPRSGRPCLGRDVVAEPEISYNTAIDYDSRVPRC